MQDTSWRQYQLLLAMTVIMIVIAIIVAKNQHSPRQATTPAAPAMAQDFILPTLAGEPFSLASIDSQLVFINFWATWCEPCRDELPALEQIQARYPRTDLTVLAINMDLNIALAKQYLEEYDIDLLVLHDKWYKVAESFAYKGLPSSFLVDLERNILQRYEGYSAGKEDTYVRDINRYLESQAREPGENPGPASPLE